MPSLSEPKWILRVPLSSRTRKVQTKKWSQNYRHKHRGTFERRPFEFINFVANAKKTKVSPKVKSGRNRWTIERCRGDFVGAPGTGTRCKRTHDRVEKWILGAELATSTWKKSRAVAAKLQDIQFTVRRHHGLLLECAQRVQRRGFLAESGTRENAQKMSEMLREVLFEAGERRRVF